MPRAGGGNGISGLVIFALYATERWSLCTSVWRYSSYPMYTGFTINEMKEVCILKNLKEFSVLLVNK